LPRNWAGIRTVGLGGMVDLPAAGPAPDGAQSWTCNRARAAGAVSAVRSLSRGLGPTQVHARPPARPPGAAYRVQVTVVMRIAYLVNQYPTVSHSFIRREIHALERFGVEVMRISLREWNAGLLDAENQLERRRTRYVLGEGLPALLISLGRILLTRPMRLLHAVGVALSMGHRAERALPIHLVYLAEACRIELWLRTAGIKHLHAHFGTNSAEVAMLVHALGGPKWSFTVHGTES